MSLPWREKSNLGLSYSILAPLLCMLIFCSIFPSDSLVPSLPKIGPDLLASANQVQVTVSIFLLASAFFQIICGYLNAKIGPKKTLILGIILFTIGGALGALSHTIITLWAARFLQGIGAASFLSLARFYLKTCFRERQHMTYMSSRFMFAYALTIAIAPSIGGIIEHHLGWRWNFWLLTLIGLMMFPLYTWALPKDDLTDQIPPKIKHIIEECKNFKFMHYVLMDGINLGFIITFFTMAPFILETTLHLPPKTVGFISALSCIPNLVIALSMKYVLRRFHPDRVISFAQIIAITGALIMATLYFLSIQNVVAIVGPFLFSLFGISLLFQCCFISAAEYAKHAAIATGLYGTVQFLIGSAISSLSALAHEDSVAPMAGIMIGSSLVAMIIHAYGLRRRKTASTPESSTL